VTIAQIETNLKALMENIRQDRFVFDLLLAYGMPRATISRLEKGELNQLESKGELLSRKNLFFKVVDTSMLHSTIDALRSRYEKEKKPPRFLIVTDHETLLAVDMKTGDTLDIKLTELPRYYAFFLPLAGMERSQIVDENPADVKAAEKMAKLYDAILQDNEIATPEDIHALNVFLTRLLFCYFAEDSGIFADNQFTGVLEPYTQSDGSDMADFLGRLFAVLDEEQRGDDLPEYLRDFPYVNGQLFSKRCAIPKFSARSRRILLELGTLDWSVINPDIFGSMIQAVITPEHRGGLGMHYTSVPNIMKVIEPLFLDDLYAEFEKAKGSTRRLNRLHLRLQNLKIFDPACGSGNFLIIAYKELRRLEMLIFAQGGLLINPSIKLSQFYGIELDDFAHEVTILSLWLAEHQMNVTFEREFGSVPPTLPLREGGHIVHGNATRLDWDAVCPKEPGDEIYVLGNPPYLGSRNQSKENKEDMKYVFKKDYKSLDYIACWFYLGANYIREYNAKLAFVTTNSITQGEQVALIWPRVLKDDIEIFFAHQSFKWTNNAKGNAGVTVVIIGLKNKSEKAKYLYKNGIKQLVKNINPYLTEGNSVYIRRKSSPISNFKPIVFGNMPNDGGNLLFNQKEKDSLIQKYPFVKKYIRSYMGAREFLNGGERYCLFIPDDAVAEIKKIPEILLRLDNIKKIRAESTEKSTREMASQPHKFYFFPHKETNSIIVPSTTSERREYIPIGFLTNETIISNSANAIYDAEPWLFAVITSKMHMVWMRTVAGRLKTDYRYSSALVYNTFPFPDITEKQKEELTEHTFRILEEREKHSEKTLAQLYDPDRMPEGLRQAHHDLDLAVERCYRKKPFGSDEERLAYLFGLYEGMVEYGA